MFSYLPPLNGTLSVCPSISIPYPPYLSRTSATCESVGYASGLRSAFPESNKIEPDTILDYIDAPLPLANSIQINNKRDPPKKILLLV